MVKYFYALHFAAFFLLGCTTPKLPGVGSAMQKLVDEREIAGAVTVVATPDKVIHLEATGFSNLAFKKPMRTDSVFWIASMTKPVTGTSLLMLQDEGKLDVHDPVSKYIPEFANLKTPSGKSANLTILQCMTHTSGLGEADANAVRKTHQLAELAPLFLARPMQYEPGAKWKYTQSGINTCAHIVEIVSGKSFDEFTRDRIFKPLGMKDTTFYPERPEHCPLRKRHSMRSRIATAYTESTQTGELFALPLKDEASRPGRPPQGNSGLFSTGPDYIRFCQMLLNGGVYKGKRYLSPEVMKLLSTVQTGDLPCGFLQTAKDGNRGANYGWGLGTCILRAPHPGVASMLLPGSFGHGGAWGTQAWIDPQRGVAYLLMIQKSGGNADNSEIRRAFQQAAADALQQ